MPFQKGHPVYLKKHTEETKKKMSLAQKGKIKPHIGIPRTEKTRQKIREKRKLQIFTIETRKKIGDAHRGEKNKKWKGGITPVNDTIRKSFEYKLWRKSVFERDNYTCTWCGEKSGEGKRNTLEADHIQLFSTHPELRFAIDNGRTLCKKCHIIRHSSK